MQPVLIEFMLVVELTILWRFVTNTPKSSGNSAFNTLYISLEDRSSLSTCEVVVVARGASSVADRPTTDRPTSLPIAPAITATITSTAPHANFLSIRAHHLCPNPTFTMSVVDNRSDSRAERSILPPWTGQSAMNFLLYSTFGCLTNRSEDNFLLFDASLTANRRRLARVTIWRSVAEPVASFSSAA